MIDQLIYGSVYLRGGGFTYHMLIHVQNTTSMQSMLMLKGSGHTPPRNFMIPDKESWCDSLIPIVIFEAIDVIWNQLRTPWTVRRY